VVVDHLLAAARDQGISGQLLEVMFPSRQQFNKSNAYLIGKKMDFSPSGVQNRKGEMDIWVRGEEIVQHQYGC
jgi:hypothetical protein